MSDNATTYNERGLFPPTLAVDFDGTLVSNKFPGIGEPDFTISRAVKAYQDTGWKIILWTCRTGEALQEAVEFCLNTFGIEFDAVNDNLPEVQRYFGGNTRKVFANLYLDDRSAALFVGEPNAAFPELAPFNLIVGGTSDHGA